MKNCVLWRLARLTMRQRQRLVRSLPFSARRCSTSVLTLCFCCVDDAEIIRQKQRWSRRCDAGSYGWRTAVSYLNSQSTQPLSLSVSPASRAVASAPEPKILFFRILPALASVCPSAPDGTKEFLSTAFYNIASSKDAVARICGELFTEAVGYLGSILRAASTAAFSGSASFSCTP